MSGRRLFRLARRATIVVGKRVPWLLNAARETVIAVRRARYGRRAASVAVEPRTVLFQSYGGRGYSCSPRAIHLTMLRDPRFEGHESIWTLRPDVAAALAQRGFEVQGLDEVEGAIPEVDLDRDFGADALTELRDATIVVYDTKAHYRALARSAYWITNSLLPDHVRPRTGQSYVQAWHGTPLKRLGNDISFDNNVLYSVAALHRRYRREGERSTVMVAPSQFAAEKFASAFDLVRTGRSDIVKVTGYPRNDALSDAEQIRVAATRDRLGLPAGKRVVLYAPTWRDDEHAGEEFVDRGRVDFDVLRDELGDDHVVLFRAHYLTAAAIDFGRYEGFLYDVSSVNDVNDLYLASDVLVTDYSSVFFDYAVLGRPIVFYMYDLEHYEREIRGFYLGLDELPGPIVKTVGDLVDAVRASSRPDPARDERLSGFRARFSPLDDGGAARRVLDLIMPSAPMGSD